jgi:hypothetical protein
VILSELTLGPPEVKSYLATAGWHPTARSRVGEIWQFGQREDDEVLVPLIETASDYAKRMHMLIEDLARIEQRPEESVRDAIRFVFYDVTDLQADSADIDDTIALHSGLDMFASAQKLVVAAAAATIRRQSHFSRSIPLRARAHANHVRLGHTKRGSYIIPIISAARPPAPLDADEELTLDLDVEESLFDRRVTVTMAQALDALAELTLRRDRQPSRSDVTSAVGEGLSYELCAAVREILKSDGIESMNVTFNWASAAQRPAAAAEAVAFPQESVEVVQRIADDLRNVPRERENIVFGVVEDLHESGDEPTARIGIKTIVDGRARKVWMELDKETYREALRCHENRLRVIARGILRVPPGREATMDVHSFGADNALPIGDESS